MKALIAALMVLVGAGGCDGDVAIDCTTRDPTSCTDGDCAYTVEECRNRCAADDECEIGESCRETMGKKVPGPAQTDDNPGSALVCVPR